ncbi:hypothetical protein [Cyanobium sp. NIES-981]|uniref:hypothetical protein n=1 Tax=Cyanobium sp. NIES-981 TaxID=1851505 RepID=UPI0012FC9AA8|nr:hypothetical protein [Cyanobium sp. NIES-981]
MTYWQICTHIEALLPPDQEVVGEKGLRERVIEQLEALESEFEIASSGESRKSYRMGAPSLIIESEAPLRAKYVGDRAYFTTVVELLDAECDIDTRLIETAKTAGESREILEARGIAVQTEDMLFQFLPEPALPTEIELSMSEQACDEDIRGDLEVYIPRRKDFFASRWVNSDVALPSEMSQLRRARASSFLTRKYDVTYFWETAACLYKLSKDQAMLASYRIDLDRNESRLLDLDRPIPAHIRNELPSAYRALIDRYTERIPDTQFTSDSGDRRPRYMQVRFKHKDLFAKLLETKLGINKPLA